MRKSAAIEELLAYVRARISSAELSVIDAWPENPDLVGFAPRGATEPAVCVSTRGKADGRFDLEFAGKNYPDCAVQGVEWAIREALQ